MKNKMKTIYNLLLCLQSKYKSYLLTEFKSYISVFLYIIIIFSVFADNMVFSAGPTCAEGDNYNAYDRCRENVTDMDEILSKFEKTDSYLAPTMEYREDKDVGNSSANKKEDELAENEEIIDTCKPHKAKEDLQGLD